MFEKIQAIRAFMQTKHLRKKLCTREDVEAWQNRKISFLLKKYLSNVSYYNNKNYASLNDLPVVDKHIMMGAFSHFNQFGISVDDIRAQLDGNNNLSHLHCGMSTGTSGNRTYYVISQRERFIWLGTILGKLLPTYPMTSAWIAVALPMATALYQSANDLWRLNLKFFNLNDGVESVTEDIEKYKPDSLIAPSHLLRYMAEAQVELPLKRLYSAGEVLEPFDRKIISSHFKVRVDEIYMVSEGLLATPCEFGKLHLCEDVMHFELREEGGEGLFNPIITDFIRNTQIMARYTLNDLLRIDDSPCLCGSPYKKIAEIVGRRDDCFKFIIKMVVSSH